MKKGFTLLELIVVIIIIGILATLGLTQYGRMVERSRGAEARAILGDMRKYAAAYRLENGNVNSISLNDLNVGAGIDQIPNTCVGRSSHFFSYNAVIPAVDPFINMTATRCTAGGKNPPGVAANTLMLNSNLSGGVDAWAGNGSY